jgi:hypothetical protein
VDADDLLRRLPGVGVVVSHPLQSILAGCRSWRQKPKRLKSSSNKKLSKAITEFLVALLVSLLTQLIHNVWVGNGPSSIGVIGTATM